MNHGMVSVFEALRKAHEEAGRPPTHPPLSNREWMRLAPTDRIEWEHNDFGRVEVRMKRPFSLGEVGSESEALWATMMFSGQPRFIDLEITVFQKPGVRVLRAKGAKDAVVTDVTGKYVEPLRVNIEWRQPAGRHQKKAGGITQPFIDNSQEDVNIFLLKENGSFIQIEVGVGKRGGKFCATVQELYCGQVARTTHEKAARINIKSVHAGKHAALVVPLFTQNAYPGADYVGTFGDSVIRYALHKNMNVPMSDAVMAEWQEPPHHLSPEMEKSGWKLATVLWFNLSWFGGAGYAQLENGETCYLYWRQIMTANGAQVANKGEFPFLPAMTRIAVMVEQGEKGLQATAIRKDIY